ncbi:CBS domain-containing protein [Thiohalomonas denitrificans]|uniref:CBS domain-containing protein n=1 Tax=Thiohalomonas denitrificans TaxID=415747 RepID=A0A1G5QHG5_9GAMM|nr:CBS domain-containing protein [Thiohalomonas denitrificans]SCZ61167.1 CBS domain-containing protein [Thiohalomonas denitrificans]
MDVKYLLRRKESANHFGVSPEQRLTDAVRLMMQHRIGSLVVMEDEKLVGIISERDVMRAADDHLDRFRDVQVKDVMTSDPVTCTAEMTVDDAMDTLLHNATGNRIRHLPVLSDGQLVGVISIGDIIQALLTETRFENRLLKHYIKNWPEEGL